MHMLAEIADKMPSTGDIVVVAMVAAGMCAGVARVNRIVASSLFVVALLAGGCLSYEAFKEGFIGGRLHDSIWIELGWRWVLATIIAPLLPAACVAGVI